MRISGIPSLFSFRVSAAIGIATAGLVFCAWSTRRLNNSLARRAVFDGRRRVLVVCTGSVAAVKTAELVRLLIEDYQVSVDLILTKSGDFFQGVEYSGKKGAEMLDELKERFSPKDGSTPPLEVWRDEDEWKDYGCVGDRVLHIDLAKRNGALLFAPLCANSLAHLVNGSAGSLALSVARAWAYDLEEEFAGPVRERCGTHVVDKPFVVAPAMNTVMWHQNVTQAHLSILKERGVVVVDPVKKTLACGDQGKGAMAHPRAIAHAVHQCLEKHELAVAKAKRDGLPEFFER